MAKIAGVLRISVWRVAVRSTAISRYVRKMHVIESGGWWSLANQEKIKQFMGSAPEVREPEKKAFLLKYRRDTL